MASSSIGSRVRPGDDGQVVAFASQAGLSDRREDLFIGGEVFLDPAVQVLVLKIEDRVIVAHGGFDEALGISGGGGADDLEPRRVQKGRLGIL